MNHGLVSFGETAHGAYEGMIRLVSRVEQYLADQGAWQIAVPAVPPRDQAVRRAGVGGGRRAPAPRRHRVPAVLPRDQAVRLGSETTLMAEEGGVSTAALREPTVRHELAALRRAVSIAAGVPVILVSHLDAPCLGFAQRDDLATLTQQGPATPDHVIRTKRLPQIGRGVAAYTKAYEEYFAAHASAIGRPVTMLDPVPWIILDPELGLCAVGRTVRDAAIAEDIYRHTIDIVLRATALGGYRALPFQDLFAVEYWDLEQVKLKTGATVPVFTGEVALVTGAASGIGKACVDSLLARSAAVVALAINPAITTIFERPDVLTFRCDVADEAALVQALESTAGTFGGLDMVILNAGIFPSSRTISDLSLANWDQAMRVNLDANLALMREAYPLLKLAPRGGRAAVIGSKNVPTPGPGAAAYSASKAALTQLAWVAALEGCTLK